MTTPTLDDILSQAEALKLEEQLMLLARLAEHVRVVYSQEPAQRKKLTIDEHLEQAQQEPAHKRSIMELHGLGKEIWEGIDAQEYVNELRAEWDHRP